MTSTSLSTYLHICVFLQVRLERASQTSDTIEQLFVYSEQASTVLDCCHYLAMLSGQPSKQHRSYQCVSKTHSHSPESDPAIVSFQIVIDKLNHSLKQTSLT
jgi:hypothetical protein